MLTAKQSLRAELRQRYRTVAPCDLSDAVRALSLYRSAQTVALYYAGGFEVSVTGLLQDTDKCLLLPRCRADGMVFCRYDGRLSPDRFGIPSPVTEPWDGPVDLMLVPALAFDRQGCRLGRGGGFYDRALAEYEGATLGVIRDEFLLEQLPVEAHDRKVDQILTEKGVYTFAWNGKG